MQKGTFISSKGKKWNIKGYDFAQNYEFICEEVQEKEVSVLEDFNIEDNSNESRSYPFHVVINKSELKFNTNGLAKFTLKELGLEKDFIREDVLTLKSNLSENNNLDSETSSWLNFLASLDIQDMIELGSLLNYVKSSCSVRNEVVVDIGGILDIKKYKIDNEFIVSVKMNKFIQVTVEKGNCRLDIKEVDYSEKLPYAVDYFKHPYKNIFEVVKEKEESFAGVIGAFRTLDEIMELHPDKDYSYILNKELILVEKGNFESVIQMFKDSKEPIALDTETDGLRITFKKEDKLVGIVLSPNEDVGYYFPFRHNSVENLCEEEEIESFIEEHFKEMLETREIILQNASFDWKVMYSEGVNINVAFDVYGAFRLTLWLEDPSMLLNLKYLAKRFLGHDSLELSDLVVGGWNESLSFRDVPKYLIALYACMDTVNTYALRNFILRENLLEYYNAGKTFNLECKFSKVVGYQEYYGHHIDVSRMPEIQRTLEEKAAQLYQEMREMVGYDFNPKSTKDLPKVLFETLKLRVVNRTEKGNPSTDKETLKILAETHRFPKILLEYREYMTQLDNFVSKVGERASNDGYSFSDIQQFLETGRIACKKPNYQSYSPEVKNYITPRPDHYYLDFDYSAVEYRIMASMAKEQVLIDKFKDPDTDIHSYQAGRMFGVPLLAVSKDLRSQSKGVSFGLFYGMQAPSLGATIFGEETPENTAKAENLMKMFFKGQEHVKNFFDTAQANSYARGWSDTYSGRRRYFNKNKYSKHKIMRMGANHRIQGTAADIFKIAMVRMFNKIFEIGWQGKMLIPFFVHDEAILEIHNSIDPVIALKNVMECSRFFIKNWAPLTNEFGWGRNWYEAKSGECPVPVQDIILAKYGETGLDWWDGDISKLVDFQVGEIHKWQKQKLIDFLEDKENHGKELSAPVLKQANALFKDLVKGDKRGVENIIVPEGIKFDKKDPLVNFKELLGILELTEVYKNAEIQEFSPDGAKPVNSAPVLDTWEIDAIEDDKKAVRNVSLKLMGAYRDSETLWVELPDENNKELFVTVMTELENIFKNNPGDTPIYFQDAKNNIFEAEGLLINGEGINKVFKYMRMVKGNVAGGIR